MSERGGAGVIRVFVFASSPVRRAGLEMLMKRRASPKLVGSTPNLAAVSAQARELQPDIILADLDRTDPQFLTAISALAEARTALGIVTLIDNPNVGWTARALRAGIKAVLPRDATEDEILCAIHAAHFGLALFNPQVTLDLARNIQSQGTDATPESFGDLTPREIEVLRMLAEGLGNKEMATRLAISEHTVKFHISSILDKIGASTRTEAVTLGIRMGLILL